jgi:two-component system, NarL family, invasion response regulator UvrY
LIEDEMVFRQRLKRALQKKKGWDEGSDLSDGQRGLDYCLLHPPDLLLVDLNLPRRHGPEIIREVRTRLESTRIPVLTGHAEPKLPAQLMGLGVAASSTRRRR